MTPIRGGSALLLSQVIDFLPQFQVLFCTFINYTVCALANRRHSNSFVHLIQKYTNPVRAFLQREEKMKLKIKKNLGGCILTVGILIILYGNFTYNTKKNVADLGDVSLTVSQKENVRIPIWAGITAIIIGGGILLYPRKKS